MINFNTLLSASVWKKKSVQVLILANLLPLLGVLLFDWSLFAVMYLYWFENVIIGLFNMMRMSRAEGKLDETNEAKLNNETYTRDKRGALIFFFLIHYGIFTIIHGVFVTSFFGTMSGQIILPPEIALGTIALLMSHAFSYYTNFIRQGEYKRVSETQLFIQPYKRVIILHVTIIFGGGLVMLFHSALPALILLIIIKTLVDVWAHSLEHDKLSATEKMILNTPS